MSTPSPRGYARGRATREDILAAATALFGEVGYTSASLREIAARVGISHPGLLHHFPSKEALLAAVLQRRDDADAADVRADVESGAGYVDALLRLVERNAARPGIVELFTVLSAEATSPEHPAHEYFRGRYARVLRSVEDDLDRFGASGRLRAGVDPAAAARLLVAVLDGLQVQWLLESGSPDRVDMVAAVRQFHDVLVGPA
ncbi:TetR/AcrR family transcriptional regulator [Cellulomonas massiliensis]|uniref:TetR/AcrR family transcriptional regulator n=1 Tax=Cellulomonas massiliensis TaxID=1465811 RepID=UPI0002DB9259|nr:TetR/AcrR family transcriptional regulator [Cellulomonas massiliensis]